MEKLEEMKKRFMKRNHRYYQTLSLRFKLLIYLIFLLIMNL